MAKRKRKRGTGSVISVKPLSGLGKVGKPGSVLGSVVPALVGVGVTGAAMLFLEHSAKPKDGQLPNDTILTLAEYSPIVGAGVGALAGAGLWAMSGAPAGITAISGAVAAGISLFGYQYLVKNESTLATDPATGPTASTSGLGAYRYRRRMLGVRGMGALVPQLQPPGMRGVGAIVMEPTATRGLGDPRGETVSLGNVNPSAFGTPGFSV